MTATVRADRDLGVGKLLDLLGVLVAGGAFVFVERHVVLSLIPDDCDEIGSLKMRFQASDVLQG
jgi:hypothetical protein